MNYPFKRDFLQGRALSICRCVQTLHDAHKISSVGCRQTEQTLLEMYSIVTSEIFKCVNLFNKLFCSTLQQIQYSLLQPSSALFTQPSAEFALVVNNPSCALKKRTPNKQLLQTVFLPGEMGFFNKQLLRYECELSASFHT